MLQILKIFFYAEKTKPWLVLLCLLLGAAAEAAGIGTLLPAVGAMISDSSGQPSPLEIYLKGFLSQLGLAPSLEILFVMLASFLILRSVLLFAASVYSGATAARLTIELRRRLIEAIFQARWSYYSEQSGGHIANELSNNAGRAGEAYGYAAVVAAMLVQTFAYLSAAMLVNWRVALVGLFAGLLVARTLAGLVAISRRTGNKVTERVATFTSDMIDVMHNIKALKSMNRYGPLVDKLGLQLIQIKRSLLRGNAARAGLTYGNDALVAIVIAVSAYLAHRFGNASVAELAVLGILFYQVIYCITRLQKNMQLAAQIESAYFAVLKMTNDAEAAIEPQDGKLLPHLDQGCTFKNVSFSHGQNPTVSNLNFTIPANKITVLQGPSGAGKTTIIDLLVGFHKPHSGEIIIGTETLENINIAAWRQSIGYVPQELMLFHDTIEANVALYDSAISSADVEKALAIAGADQFLKELPQGTQTDVGEMGGKLSGGQRQRISLARALVKNPKIIILDEVTSALDPKTEAEIIRNIVELRDHYTVVAITHRPAWTSIADKLYKVDAGHISEIRKSRKQK